MKTIDSVPFQIDKEMTFSDDWDIATLRDHIAGLHQVDPSSIRFFHGMPKESVGTSTPIRELVGSTVSIRPVIKPSNQQISKMRVARKVKAGYVNARSTKHLVAVETKVDGVATAVGGVATAVGEVGSTRNPGSLYALMDTSGN